MVRQEDYWVINRAWARDDEKIYTGEALLLACLMQAKGNRAKDIEDVQKIMHDINLKR